MANVSDDDIRTLAKLVRIHLDDSEIEQYRQEIMAILAFVEQLQGVDTTGVDETTQVSGLTSVTRPDEVIDYGVTRDELLQNAPEQENGYIKVRRVL